MPRPLTDIRAKNVADRIRRQRAAAAALIAVAVAASLITGRLWPVAVDHGGASAGNPIGRYGPHWLYPTLVTIVVAVLLVVLARTAVRRGTSLALTAFAAGGASNLAQ